ncbi:MAG: pseudouridine synthase [Bryobacteraceae bacterium]
MPEERLQKILSQTGVTSRRKAEDMILQGRVTVNGEVITELGSKADIETDHIKVDGTLLKAPHKLVYLALHKPREVVTTVSDPEGRQTVMHLLRGVKERVFPVGRLDYSSEGLLLLTNDGEFAHRITAPASHVVKTYVVKVNGTLTDEQVANFASGIPLHGRRTAPAHIKMIKPGDNPWYEVRLSEGRQNQIRMMFKHFSKLVEKLRRVKIGFLELDLAPGRFRALTLREVEKFRQILKLDQPDAKPSAVPVEEAVATAPRPVRSAKAALLVRRPRRFAPSANAAEESEEAAPPSRPAGPNRFGGKPQGDRPFRAKPTGDRPPSRGSFGDKPFRGKPSGDRPTGDRPPSRGTFGDKPFRGKPSGDSPTGDRPPSRGSFGDKPFRGKPSGDRPTGDRPPSRGSFGDKPFRGKPSGDRPSGDRPPSRGSFGDKPFRGKPSGDRPTGDRPPSGRPPGGRPSSGRPPGARPSGGRPSGGKPTRGKPRV